MRTAIVLGLAAFAFGGPAGALTPPPRWPVFADCAAAYLANARIADPDRPASMTSQVSDVADDYAKAARNRYRRQFRSSAAAARRAVQARIDRQAQRFAGQSREAVEHVIDACPQP